jgi:hypothetical protein
VEIFVHVSSLSFPTGNGKGRKNDGAQMRSFGAFFRLNGPGPGAAAVSLLRLTCFEPCLLLCFDTPMKPGGEMPTMQVTVTVSDAIVREATAHSLSVIDYVESLIDKGMLAASEPPVVDDAIERIRRLRSGKPASRH